jgi:hypothetical protein
MALTTYSGTVPDPRTQTGSTLTTNMQDFIDWFVANAPEVASHVSTLVALAGTAAWSDSTTYSVNDTVYNNGHTFRCASGCTDVEPGVDSGWRTYWVQLTFGVLQESEKTASFTAEVNKYRYYINNSGGGGEVVTLPNTNLVDGDQIILFGNPSSASVTLTCDGININGSASDETALTNERVVTITYTPTFGWHASWTYNA